ncbi:FG-GAP-like repeat-containing protein [Streptomyces sp. Ru87]|uniref:FG-GAP-like repeat-containing protein n=1 Tax=Streptomyces sp. Ru87 TaxID=2044307 RepID=UPI00211D9AB1|nr:FG-GAP-like repeat-containing protein [Streptomyces sp. Ru87]
MSVKLIEPHVDSVPQHGISTPLTRFNDPLADTEASAAATARPPITSRAGWDANEGLPETPGYGTEVKAVFVHPSGGTNDYSCADSPTIVKGIQTYHTTDPDHMWNDIGFNFLVDKCGTIYEGRAGGIDRPVTGFHTPGFNTDSVGVALLGDMGSGKPTPAALESLARLAAWKLSPYEGDPQGTTVMTATASNGKHEAGEQVTLPVIAAARDAMPASTPDENLAAKLPSVRFYAASPAASSAIPTADYNRDGITDLAVGTPQSPVNTRTEAGAITVVPGSTSGPNASAKLIVSQNSTGVPGSAEAGDEFGTDSAYGDLNADGYADLVLGAPGEDDTSGHTDNGYVVALYGPGLDTGVGYNLSAADLVNGARLGDAVTVSDFNSDGKADIFAIAPGTPTSWWVYDSGSTATTSGRLLTSTTGTVTHPDATSGDFDKDGYADVAITYLDPDGTGRVMLFKGSATGLQPNGLLGSSGGRTIASGDINGDDITDIVVGQPYTAESGAHSGGQVTAFYGSSSGITTASATTLHQDSDGVPGAAEAGDAMGAAVSVGDYNLDGYADLLTGLPNEDITRDSVARTNAGATLLLPGSSSGLTGTGSLAINQDTTDISGATESDDRFGSAVTLTDLRGTAQPDIAIGADGENSGDGTVLQIDIDATGVVFTSGLYYGPGTLGLPAASHIGQTLAP